jgi:type I restriction enzyme, S subunit
MSWPRVALGDYVEIGSPRVEPSTLDEPVVAHYSLPAFDLGRGPELVSPTSIKSIKQRLDRDYVLVSKLNPSIPRIWHVGEPGLLVRLASTEFLPIQPKRTDLDIRFLAHLFESPAFTDAMASEANGTSSSHQRVSPTAVLRYEVELPPLSDQLAIADALAAIDIKVALTDDVIARAEALLSREYLGALGSDPEEIRLESVAAVTKGVSYTSDDLRAGGSGALFSLKCFARDGSFTEAGLKSFDGPHKVSQRLSVGDIVVAQTDLTQDASVVGRVLRVPDGLEWNPVVASLDVAIVRSTRPELPQQLLAVALRDEDFREHCRSRSVGTTVLHLRAGSIESFALAIPAQSQVDRLADLAAVTYQLTDGLRRERRRLRSTRQVLIDELLSGRRRVVSP